MLDWKNTDWFEVGDRLGESLLGLPRALPAVLRKATEKLFCAAGFVVGLLLVGAIVHSLLTLPLWMLAIVLVLLFYKA